MFLVLVDSAFIFSVYVSIIFLLMHWNVAQEMLTPEIDLLRQLIIHLLCLEHCLYVVFDLFFFLSIMDLKRTFSHMQYRTEYGNKAFLFIGHRAVYVGVHVPLGRQSRRRHRTRGHKHHRKRRDRGSEREDGRESPAYGKNKGLKCLNATNFHK